MRNSPAAFTHSATPPISLGAIGGAARLCWQVFQSDPRWRLYVDFGRPLCANSGPSGDGAVNRLNSTASASLRAPAEAIFCPNLDCV